MKVYIIEGVGTCCHGKSLRFSQNTRHVHLILRHQQSKGRIDASERWLGWRATACVCVCVWVGVRASGVRHHTWARCRDNSCVKWKIQPLTLESCQPHIAGVIRCCNLGKWRLQFTLPYVNNIFITLEIKQTSCTMWQRAVMWRPQLLVKLLTVETFSFLSR